MKYQQKIPTVEMICGDLPFSLRQSRPAPALHPPLESLFLHLLLLVDHHQCDDFQWRFQRGQCLAHGAACLDGNLIFTADVGF
jgi:hypothetical protein